MVQSPRGKLVRRLTRPLAALASPTAPLDLPAILRLPAILAILAGSAPACEEPRRRPWELDSDGGPPPVFTPPPSSLPLSLAPTSSAGAPGADTTAAADLVPVSPVRVGGAWVRCYGNFHLSGDPVKDVTRLALLCGPENGMKRLSPQTIVGSVIGGQPGVSETFQARRGECYRVFAVAERTVDDLDITVRSSRDMAIAADHGEDGWPIAQPDRPFCVLEDDGLRVEISARRGQGRFAAEIWVLPPPPRSD